MKNIYKIIAAIFVGLLFVIACQNKQIPFKSTSGLQDEVSLLKNTFDVKGFSSQLQDKFMNGQFLAWTPLWDSTTKKVVSGKQTFFYVPLSPHIEDANHNPTNAKIFIRAYKKYLLISKVADSAEFNIALYITSDTSRSKRGTISDADFFKSFTGTMTSVVLGIGTLRRYSYTKGTVIHPSPAQQTVKKKATTMSVNSAGGAIASGHYEDQCTTIYTCYWDALSYYTGEYVSTVTTTSDGCTPPEDLPFPDDAEYGAFGSGNWELNSSSQGQDCQTVWVEDPPTPGSGSGGSGSSNYLDSVTLSNLNDTCYINTIQNVMNDSNATYMSRLLNNTFNLNDHMNLTFFEKDSTHDDFDTDASTLGYKDKQTGNIFIQITYNNFALRHASLEFIAETTLHEILHAYMEAETSLFSDPINWQHQMMSGYVACEREALQSLFPNLSTNDANGLILGGLEKALTSVQGYDFDALCSTYGLTRQQVDDINLNYVSGSAGTRCGN